MLIQQKKLHNRVKYSKRTNIRYANFIKVDNNTFVFEVKKKEKVNTRKFSELIDVFDKKVVFRK